MICSSFFQSLYVPLRSIQIQNLLFSPQQFSFLPRESGRDYVGIVLMVGRIIIRKLAVKWNLLTIGQLPVGTHNMDLFRYPLSPYFLWLKVIYFCLLGFRWSIAFFFASGCWTWGGRCEWGGDSCELISLGRTNTATGESQLTLQLKRQSRTQGICSGTTKHFI